MAFSNPMSSVRALFRNLNNAVDLLACSIHIRTVINAHHDRVLAVVGNHAEGMDIHPVSILLVTGIYEHIVNYLGMIEIGKLIFADDFLIEKIVGQRKMLAVDIHSIVGEVKHRRIIYIGTVFIIGSFLNIMPSVRIIVSFKMNRTDDTAEMRFIDFMTLLCGLIEILDLS